MTLSIELVTFLFYPPNGKLYIWAELIAQDPFLLKGKVRLEPCMPKYPPLNPTVYAVNISACLTDLAVNSSLHTPLTAKTICTHNIPRTLNAELNTGKK